ncbi:MAG: hypothetical protein HY921_03225 [Elusimicrobia bacterium]|nr:hypothetical protein [Elusimicrobiota bacterium]
MKQWLNRFLATAVAAAVVMVSPGLGCYQAMAGGNVRGQGKVVNLGAVRPGVVTGNRGNAGVNIIGANAMQLDTQAGPTAPNATPSLRVINGGRAETSAPDTRQDARTRANLSLVRTERVQRTSAGMSGFAPQAQARVQAAADAMATQELATETLQQGSVEAAVGQGQKQWDLKTVRSGQADDATVVNAGKGSSSRSGLLGYRGRAAGRRGMIDFGGFDGFGGGSNGRQSPQSLGLILGLTLAGLGIASIVSGAITIGVGLILSGLIGGSIVHSRNINVLGLSPDSADDVPQNTSTLKLVGVVGAGVAAAGYLILGSAAAPAAAVTLMQFGVLPIVMGALAYYSTQNSKVGAAVAVVSFAALSALSVAGMATAVAFAAQALTLGIATVSTELFTQGFERKDMARRFVAVFALALTGIAAFAAPATLAASYPLAVPMVLSVLAGYHAAKYNHVIGGVAAGAMVSWLWYVAGSVFGPAAPLQAIFLMAASTFSAALLMNGSDKGQLESWLGYVGMAGAVAGTVFLAVSGPTALGASLFLPWLISLALGHFNADTPQLAPVYGVSIALVNIAQVAGVSSMPLLWLSAAAALYSRMHFRGEIGTSHDVINRETLAGASLAVLGVVTLAIGSGAVMTVGTAGAAAYLIPTVIATLASYAVSKFAHERKASDRKALSMTLAAGLAVGLVGTVLAATANLPLLIIPTAAYAAHMYVKAQKEQGVSDSLINNVVSIGGILAAVASLYVPVPLLSSLAIGVVLGSIAGVNKDASGRVAIAVAALAVLPVLGVPAAVVTSLNVTALASLSVAELPEGIKEKYGRNIGMAGIAMAFALATGIGAPLAIKLAPVILGAMFGLSSEGKLTVAGALAAVAGVALVGLPIGAAAHTLRYAAFAMALGTHILMRDIKSVNLRDMYTGTIGMVLTGAAVAAMSTGGAVAAILAISVGFLFGAAARPVHEMLNAKVRFSKADVIGLAVAGVAAAIATPVGAAVAASIPTLITMAALSAAYVSRGLAGYIPNPDHRSKLMGVLGAAGIMATVVGAYFLAVPTAFWGAVWAPVAMGALLGLAIGQPFMAGMVSTAVATVFHATGLTANPQDPMSQPAVATVLSAALSGGLYRKSIDRSRFMKAAMTGIAGIVGAVAVSSAYPALAHVILASSVGLILGMFTPHYLIAGIGTLLAYTFLMPGFGLGYRAAVLLASAAFAYFAGKSGKDAQGMVDDLAKQ